MGLELHVCKLNLKKNQIAVPGYPGLVYVPNKALGALSGSYKCLIRSWVPTDRVL
jgi:hypothetical protein